MQRLLYVSESLIPQLDAQRTVGQIVEQSQVKTVSFVSQAL